MGMSARERDIHSGVVPDSVSATMARTFMWLAVYMTATATASWVGSPIRSTRWRTRCVVSWYVSAPLMTSSMDCTALTGYLPTALSAESITASVPSSTAFETSDTSARVGTGALIIDSIICVAVMHTLLRVRDSWMMVFCRPVMAA